MHLVDTEGKGVDRVTEKGVEFGGKVYDVDCIIWGTGFVSPFIGSAAGKGGIEVKGRDGVSLEECNDKGEVSTLHGVVARGFPNMFWPGMPRTNQSLFRETMTLMSASLQVQYREARVRT